MEILKEEKLEENECPKCGEALEFNGNQMKNLTFWQNFFYPLVFAFIDHRTGNGWFACSKCNKRYLIKDYVDQVEDVIRGKSE